MDPSQHSNIKLYQKGKKYTYALVKKAGSSPLLTGKAYSSKKARNNGIQNLIKNLDRIETQEQDKRHFYTIKSGNNQALAKSVFFDSVQEMHEAIDFISSLFEVEKTAPSKTTSDSIDEPPKYSFKLKFYIPDSQGPLRGRIEYPFKKEKKVFNGIDIQTIEDFLRNYLPLEEKLVVPAAAAAAAVLSTKPVIERTISEATTNPLLTPTMMQVTPPLAVKEGVDMAQGVMLPNIQPSKVIVPNTNTINFDFINWDTKHKNNLNLNTASEAGIQVDLTSITFSKEIYTDLMISLSSATFGIKVKALLGQQLLKTEDLNQISIPINLSALPSLGLHKFELLMKFMAQDQSIPPFYLVGSKMASLN